MSAPDDPAAAPLHLRIHGRVQGVGFRESMIDEATRLGVRGWVRNRGDGTVEAVMEGAAGSRAALLAWARRGPPGARVTRIDERVATAPETDTIGARFVRLPSEA